MLVFLCATSSSARLLGLIVGCSEMVFYFTVLPCKSNSVILTHA